MNGPHVTVPDRSSHPPPPPRPAPCAPRPAPRLVRAVASCGPGHRLGDSGAVIQGLAESRGYGLGRDFVGHGVGRAMHEDPKVPNHGAAGSGRRLKSGMTIAIEPMLNLGGSGIRVLEDRWTVITADGSLLAHVEHTVAVTEHGAELLAA